MTTIRTASALIGMSLGMIALSGCSVMSDTVSNQRALQYESVTDLEIGWDKDAPWLPPDATDIRIRESTSGDPAVLRAVTGTELDPKRCVITTRQSDPTFTDTWTPDPYVDDIWACDDWAVIATDDGWFGWTPLDPDEKAAAEKLLSEARNSP
jgi:hypothetical protein